MTEANLRNIKATVEERLDEAGLATDRFINLQDGEKAPINHNQEEPNKIRGNYGVYANRGLALVDVDNAEELPDGLNLKKTLKIKSPHSENVEEGHYYYKVAEDTPEILNRIYQNGKDTKEGNLNPPWGELRVKNQYVVGPGSRLTNCKHDCCSEEDPGSYEIENDTDIAELSFDELKELLDPFRDEIGETDREKDENNEIEIDKEPPTDAEFTNFNDTALETIREWDEKLDGLLTHLEPNYSLPEDDDSPSGYDLATVSKLWYYGFDKHDIASILKRYRGRDKLDRDDYLTDTIREGVGGERIDKEKHRENGEPSEEKTRFNPTDVVEKGPGYSIRAEDSDGEVFYIPITNFKIDVEAFIHNVDEDTRLIKAEIIPDPRQEPSYEVEFEPKVFNRTDRFSDKVATGFSTTLEGGREELNELRKYVSAQDAPILEGTQKLGLHNGEWVTPNGTLGSDGWKDEPETTFFGRDVALERKWDLDEDKDTYDEEEIAEILELLPQTRKTERFLPVIGWYYATAFRPTIVENTGHFPVLSVHGDTGSGKTHTLKMMWELFGVDPKPFSVDSTNFSQITTFSATNSLPIWYDEYKPSDIKDSRIEMFHKLIRKSTSGAIEQRGNPDKSTDSYEISAPVVVSGEQRFKDPAERRRSIITNFHSSTTESGTETSKSYAEIVGDSYEENNEVKYAEKKNLKDHALAYYQYILSLDESRVKGVWKEAADFTYEVLAKHGLSELNDTERQGLQTVVFGYRLFTNFAGKMGAELDELPTEEELERTLVYLAENVGPGGKRRRHIDELLEVFANAANRDYLEEGEEYKFIKDGKELRFNLSQSYDPIQKYVKDYNLNKEILEKGEYLDRFKDEAGRNNSYTTTTQQNTPPIGRAIGVKFEKASKRCDITRSMLTDVAEEQTINTLDEQEEGDNVTITAEVWDENDHETESIIQHGELKDITGTVRFVVWDDSGQEHLEPNQTYRFEKVTVNTYQGEKQVEIGSETTVEEIAKGVGFTLSEDPGENEQIPGTDPRKAIVKTINGGVNDKEELIEKVTEEKGFDTEKVERVYRTLLDNGVIVEVGDEIDIA